MINNWPNQRDWDLGFSQMYYPCFPESGTFDTIFERRFCTFTFIMTTAPTAIFDSYLKLHLPDLTDAERTRVYTSAEVKKLNRKQKILLQGEVCRQKKFVLSGLLRTYSTGEDGQDYLMKFTPETTWTTDPESFNTGTPSQFNIEAIEPSEILVWKRSVFEGLRQEIPQLRAFSEKIVERSSIEAQRRILLNISAPPEVRYREFENTHPALLARIPLHMIASYLGLSRKTLARVRHDRVTAGKP